MPATLRQLLLKNSGGLSELRILARQRALKTGPSCTFDTAGEFLMPRWVWPTTSRRPMSSMRLVGSQPVADPGHVDPGRGGHAVQAGLRHPDVSQTEKATGPHTL